MPVKFILFHIRHKGTKSFKATERVTRNTERGTRNTERGTRNSERGTRNTELGTRNTESITLSNILCPVIC